MYELFTASYIACNDIVMTRRTWILLSFVIPPSQS